MKELIRRWRSEVPDFWKSVRNMAIVIVTACGTLYGLNDSMDLHLPAAIVTVLKYGVAIGATMGLNAQLTTKDNVNS